MSESLFEDVYVETVLGRIRLRVGGDGPAILFWPSLLMDGSMWLDIARRLQPHYKVVLIDPPGHGASSPLTRGFDFAACAICLREIVDALQLTSVHYVGNSWGAMIGGTFAALYPDRVGKLVLMNGTASPCSAWQRIEYNLLIRMGLLLGGIRGPLRGSAEKAFLGPTTRANRPAVVTGLREALSRVDFRSVRWAVESVVPRRPDQLALYAAVRAPVLVVAGAEDATFPIDETRMAANAIPGASFVVLKGVAHLAGFESPGEVSELIDGFIRATD